MNRSAHLIENTLITFECICPRCLKRHLREIMQIERENFEFPWSKNNFIDYLSQPNCCGITAKYMETVVGFMTYEFDEGAMCLSNIAMRQDFGRKGIGGAMVRLLINGLNPQKRNTIFAEVRETNLQAQLFFRALGFRAVCTLYDWYKNEGIDEDCYLMQYLIKKQTFFRDKNRISAFSA